ncbi:hypothetical protein [Ancrocorticia sp.]|uniref:hypothetical protein n=1 Tax=Ancrocorticia sp. TaxID=2593684 RepID=UPI003F907AFA
MSSLKRTAELDPETGIVQLPSDSVELGEQVDSSVLTSAYMASVAQCSRDNLDIPWVAERPDPYMPSEHMWSRYGPWTKSIAEKYAFVRPMGDGALIVNDIVPEPEDHEWVPDPNEGLSMEERQDVFDNCENTAEVQKFNEENLWTPSPGMQELNEEVEAVDLDPRMVELFSELEECYVSNGMEMHPEVPWYPAGADFENINEEQVELALKTVECKDQIDFTQRAADVTAERQVPIIEEYAEELFAAKEKWDNTVEKAEEYIAAHPELFEAP